MPASVVGMGYTLGAVLFAGHVGGIVDRMPRLRFVRSAIAMQKVSSSSESKRDIDRDFIDIAGDNLLDLPSCVVVLTLIDGAVLLGPLRDTVSSAYSGHATTQAKAVTWCIVLTQCHYSQCPRTGQDWDAHRHREGLVRLATLGCLIPLTSEKDHNYRPRGFVPPYQAQRVL